MTRTDSMPAVLERARDLVGPSLRRAIERLSPELRPLATYHLGWSDADGRPCGGDGGKGVRPALSVLSAEAVGAAPVFGVPGGVAIELVHNFSLIHDDVIDEDAERRHRPTIWSLFGIGRAVIAGDALVALAQQVLLDPGVLALGEERLADPPTAVAAARSIADATAAMIAGQALDMAFEAVPVVDVEGCLAMEAGKTGALLSCAASIGALLAGAPFGAIEALSSFGMELGLAFQAVDDVLGIWGDPASTGKPAFSDLHQHKKTLPIAAALAGGGPRAEELAALVATPELSSAEVARAAELVEACGGREVAESEARRRLGAALGALERAELRPGPCEELCEVAAFVVERQH